MYPKYLSYESEPFFFNSSLTILSIGHIEDGTGDLRFAIGTSPSRRLHALYLISMAPTLALSGRAPALLRSARRVPLPAAHSIRAFTAAQSNVASRLPIQTQQSLQKRSFLTTARCLATAATQSAPDPQAYLQSGVVKAKANVDVKKVLVIGSGGLAIGQAGEFDYSGSCILDIPKLLGELSKLWTDDSRLSRASEGW